MSLKVYNRKRKFDRTPEPNSKGKRPAGKGNLTFVIQKHAATRMHYDFRLELDGALKSWAVPRGPTLTSQNPRLAVLVEDHPIPYGKFEGVIPKGNYGAGTVMIWDSGYYIERTSKGRKDSEKALRKGFEKGHITFLLHGSKLQGEFALVRIKKKGAPDNGWLLLKKHDAYASRADVLLEDRSVATGRTMQEIASQAEANGEVWLPKRKKNAPPKPAPTRSRPIHIPPAKKAVQSSMPRRVRVMQPVSSAVAPEKGWLFEASGDGLRAVAEVSPGSAKLYSRMFLSFDKKFPDIALALKKLGVHALFDGEIEGEGKRAVYSISDLLFFEGQDLRPLGLSERKKILSKIPLSAPLQLVESSSDIKDISSSFVVAKRLASPYVSGMSRDWLKLKSSAKKGKPVKSATAEKPPLTHPDKIYWPKEGYTKGDLIKYYDSIASYILPHLVDRPQSLHRQPDGIRNEGFFHKDMSGFLPRRIETVKVFSGSASKTVNYVLCQDKWALLFLANMGCIELNPWLSRRESLENPDYVVIDLDPDGNDFAETVKVALEVHRILDKVGAKSYCKTSGASGLHICIPTGGRYDFDTGRLFAEAVCKVVHQKFPSFTSVERNPARRKGRIYLDFLQNRRGQTLAAPYCVRPRPGATVSTPLKWSEVNSKLNPADFTIKNMAQRLKKVGDLWKPVLDGSCDLEKCMKQLSKLYHI